MSIEADLNSMFNRLTQGSLSPVKKKRIDIYTYGVKAKLYQAEYAFENIKSLSSPTKITTINTKTQDYPASEKIHFFTDSFFAFLYSSFDIVSQVVNQKYGLIYDEKKVSFNKVNEIISTSSQFNGSTLKKMYKDIGRSNFFINLEKYRHCSTHRRQIFIRELINKVKDTPGYSSTGETETIEVRILCDDPFSLNPSIKQNRELVAYTEKALINAKKRISKIAKNL